MVFFQPSLAKKITITGQLVQNTSPYPGTALPVRVSLCKLLHNFFNLLDAIIEEFRGENSLWCRWFCSKVLRFILGCCSANSRSYSIVKPSPLDCINISTSSTLTSCIFPSLASSTMSLTVADTCTMSSSHIMESVNASSGQFLQTTTHTPPSASTTVNPSKSVLASTRLEDPSKKGTSPNRRGRPNRHQSLPAPREKGLIQPNFR